jgi:hypothetical protein
VLDGVPAAVAALRHLHPGAISDAFQEVTIIDLDLLPWLLSPALCLCTSYA